MKTKPCVKFLSHFREQYAGFLALFIVLGGTSYAVATNSIGSAEIKNNSVQSKDIRNGSVSGADVKDASLAAADFRPGQLPPGAAGPQGSPGARGATGSPGPQGSKGDPCPSSDLLCRGPKGDTGAGAATNVTVRSRTTEPTNHSGTIQVSCMPGEKAVGGGGIAPNAFLSVSEPAPDFGTPTGWIVSGSARESDGSYTPAASITGYAVCVAP